MKSSTLNPLSPKWKWPFPGFAVPYHSSLKHLWFCFPTSRYTGIYDFISSHPAVKGLRQVILPDIADEGCPNSVKAFKKYFRQINFFFQWSSRLRLTFSLYSLRDFPPNGFYGSLCFENNRDEATASENWPGSSVSQCRLSMLDMLFSTTVLFWK